MCATIDVREDLWFASKDTISKKYGGSTFLRIFLQRGAVTEKMQEKFRKAGITYFYTLIDDAVARVMKSEGGYVWACKNYDGDALGGHNIFIGFSLLL